MFGSSLVKAAAVGIVQGLIRQLDVLAEAIQMGDKAKALAIVAEMKDALNKVLPWLSKP